MRQLRNQLFLTALVIPLAVVAERARSKTFLPVPGVHGTIIKSISQLMNRTGYYKEKYFLGNGKHIPYKETVFPYKEKYFSGNGQDVLYKEIVFPYKEKYFPGNRQDIPYQKIAFPYKGKAIHYNTISTAL